MRKAMHRRGTSGMPEMPSQEWHTR